MRMQPCELATWTNCNQTTRWRQGTSFCTTNSGMRTPPLYRYWYSPILRQAVLPILTRKSFASFICPPRSHVEAVEVPRSAMFLHTHMYTSISYYTIMYAYVLVFVLVCVIFKIIALIGNVQLWAKFVDKRPTVRNRQMRAILKKPRKGSKP